MGVRGITLGTNPLVPVVVRGSRVFYLDRLDPRILPRGLVEVAMDAEKPFPLLSTLFGGLDPLLHDVPSFSLP